MKYKPYFYVYLKISYNNKHIKIQNELMIHTLSFSFEPKKIKENPYKDILLYALNIIHTRLDIHKCELKGSPRYSFKMRICTVRISQNIFNYSSYLWKTPTFIYGQGRLKYRNENGGKQENNV